MSRELITNKHREKILEEKFLWLQVLHIVEDTLPTDNPATGHKTIEALFDKFEIKLRGTSENQSIH